MGNSEQHEMLVGILCNLVPILTCDELSLLAHSCGVPVDEFYGHANKEEFSFDWNIEQCSDNDTIELRKTRGCSMNKTQIISLREQTRTLRDYKNFHGDKEQISLTEAIGWAVLAVCFFGLMFGFLGG